MISFIKTVLLDLKNKGIDIEDVHFILPSKRAGVFLKHQLSSLLDNPIFSPRILSIEEFVEELSGLQTLSNTELLFKLYTTYKKLTPKEEQESFDSFSNWAQILLQDFNEIDRYLIPQEKIFDYLLAIKELDHWSVDSESTDLIKNHLKFWNRLKDYYITFTHDLLESKRGYQGLIYREASNKINDYISKNPNQQYVFLGFNALNTAESQIIQTLLEKDEAKIYWDIDKTFVDDTIHDAGLFVRQHKNNWPYFDNHDFNWVTDHYKESKNIEVIGIPKQVGQAKYVGQLLENIYQKDKNLSNIAVVLGEENLLVPILNSIPKEISAINVTMGTPLNLSPLATLFEYLFSLHKHQTNNYYFKDVITILSHPSVYQFLNTNNSNESQVIIEHIQKNNIIYLSLEELQALVTTNTEIISLLFKSWEDNSEIALKNCTDLIFKLKSNYAKDKSKNTLELEYLFRFNSLFNQLNDLNNQYQYLNTVSVLHSIFNELLSTETLDFKGEPLEGLQIMGMLESRVLDFETVIITSVNEGILPSGKTNNSFIPYDVKVQNNLPTYKEKDAVYTYHFYRLLQRAKNVFIIYNTEVDVLKGGEKSRFITQLEVEGYHKINHSIASPKVPVIEQNLMKIPKTDLVLESLKVFSAKGFSPSSLTNYIRNPLDFYFDKVLDISEFNDVEENIAANTLGSVIHNTLEDFYKPLETKIVTLEHIAAMKLKIHDTVTYHFKDIYKKGDINKGKNLIIFEIAKRYIVNFLNTEIETIKDGNVIKIIAIESDFKIPLSISELDFPVYLKGKVDRVDEFNGVTRIIDYKSGKVEQNKVEISDWEDLTSDYDKYSKSFQVLCYAFMMKNQNKINLPIEGGIISFKNLSAGFLKFGKKDADNKSKNQLIGQDTLDNFEIQLKKLIIEICDSQTDFTEKEIENAY